MNLFLSLPRRRRRPAWPTRRPVAAIVTVDGKPFRTQLSEKPDVGTKIDVGFPVVVTEAKAVFGGGVLVQAEDLTTRPRH